MSRKNSGQVVKLKDGRIGFVFNKNRGHSGSDGKIPVDVYELVIQPDIFHDQLSQIKSMTPKKLLICPKDLELIGLFD